MLLRTHLIIVVFFILIFINHVNDPLLFVVVALISTIAPDIDNGFSSVGSNKLFKPLQFFTKHRGVIHSLTLGIIIAFILALFFPYLSLAFFLGYSIHIFTDSFTKEGVTPFWPYSKESKGLMKTGGITESVVFVTFIVFDLIMIYLVFF